MKEKCPIFIMANDIHIEKNKLTLIEDILNQLLARAIEYGVPIILAGDVLQSRSAQRLSELNLFDKFLTKASDSGVKIFAIAGNHDKTKYDTSLSFLTQFRHFPSFTLFEETSSIVLDGVTIDLLPFFVEDMMVERLNSMKGADILIAHFELDGSINNGIVASERTIKPHMLKKWKSVKLGHYHNHHKVTDSITHCPSPYQKNYGEDDNKGFTLVYNDGSDEILKSKFKPFKVIKISIEDIDTKKVKELIKEAESDVNLRVEVYGSVDKVKAFNKDKMVMAGIDVKKKFEDISVSLEDTNSTVTITKSNVMPTFEEWCKNEGLDQERGKKYLIQ